MSNFQLLPIVDPDSERQPEVVENLNRIRGKFILNRTSMNGIYR